MEGDKEKRRPLTYDDRLAIERGLNRGDTVSWIARTIGRAPKVVREEIRRNWTDDPRGHLTIQNRNICVKYAECEVRRLCKTMCIAPCRKCRDWLCNRLCPDFEARPCPRLERTPFCCNSCPERQGFGCSHMYRFYEASWAHDLADARRSEARSGIDCDPEAFERAVAVITDGLSKGQSPQHIIAANPGDIPFGMRSLYNYLGGAKMGTLSKLDLPRAVRYRPRSRTGDGGKSPQIPRAALEGRRWSDFDALTGRDMAACMSHVNSYMVGSMGWASPMDLAIALFPKGLLDAYGVERVDPREVNLTPGLVPHAMTQL